MTFVILGRPVCQKNSKQIAKNRKTGKLFIRSNDGVLGDRGQRADVDNLACAPLDALQAAGIVKNDYQIERLTCERRRDAARPRVEITLQRLE